MGCRKCYKQPHECECIGVKLDSISVSECEKITEAIDELRRACVGRDDGIVPSRNFILSLLCGTAIDHEDCQDIEGSW